MKAKHILLPVTVLFSLGLVAQEFSQFIGTYIVQESCVDDISGRVFPLTKREITIERSSADTFDIQFMLSEYMLRSEVLHETGFQTPQQTFPNHDGTPLYISGQGSVIKDSLFYDYNAGGSGGLFICSCKGIKKNVTALSTEAGVNPMIRLSTQPAGRTLLVDLSNVPSAGKGFIAAIYSTDGALLVKENTFGADSISINISHLPAGMYVLHVSNNNEEYSEQFVKE